MALRFASVMGDRIINRSSWSLNLGSWGGVTVRLHVALPLVMLCALLMSNDTASYGRAKFPIEHVALLMVLGLASVAVHAISHVMVAGRYGVDTPELVLAPWGEWNGTPAPHSPEAALSAQVAGIFANGLVCALSAIWLWLAGDGSIRELLIPLDSQLLLQSESRHVTVRWLFCMNYSLVLMNLIPAAPFDGSRITRSFLNLALPQFTDDQVRDAVTLVGRIAGLVFLTLAITIGLGDKRGLLPAWFPLTVLGLVALFAAEAPAEPERRQTADRRRDRSPPLPDPGHDLSDQQMLDWEDAPLAQWLEEKRDADRARHEEVREAEIDDERRVDEILTRMHDEGPQCLTPEDRVILQRVSDRLRLRKQKNQ